MLDAGGGVAKRLGQPLRFIGGGVKLWPLGRCGGASAKETPMTTDTPESKKVPASKVLVVDDNVQNLELLVEYLKTIDGCETSTAVDGVAALEAIAEAKPDLILLDIMMPRMSGYEVCRRLKSDPETRDIPIIMVTALNELGDMERAVESGTDDFLSKPVNRLELVTRVKSLLKVRYLKDELERTLAYLNDVETNQPID